MTADIADAWQTDEPTSVTVRPRMVLVPFQGSHLTELLRVARIMRDRGSFEIVFCIGAGGREGKRLAGIATEAGFAVLDLAPPPEPHQWPGGSIRRAWQRFFNKRVMLIEGYRRRYEVAEAESIRRDGFVGVPFQQKLITQTATFGAYLPLHVVVTLVNRAVNTIGIIRLFDFIWVATHELRRIRRFLTDRQVSLLVFSEDNVEMGAPLWIRAGRDLGVASVVVPFTIANALEPYESYRNQRDHWVRARPLNMLAGWIFPKWQVHYKGKRFLRATGDRIIALELLGCAPPNPWILNSGYVNAIAAESKAMVAYYQECGIPNNKLVLTGSLADDVIYNVRQRREALRDELVHDLGLEPGWPILLCAFPPNQLGSRPQTGFASYAALWRSYILSLNKIGQWNIVVRLHPRTAPSDIDRAALGRAVICDWDTAVLVALCDLYVATVSATIRWAIACGTPVLNYDVYDYRYSDYRGVANVFTTAERDKFEAELLRLTGDRSALDAARQGQSAVAAQWGILDGRSGERIARLFEGLVAAPTSTTSVRQRTAV